MSYLTFIQPQYLWILLIIPVIYIFYRIAVGKKRKAAVKFSNLGLIKQATSKKHRIRDNLFFYLSVIIIALIITGFADPHIPLKQTKQGVNVVLSIDVSGSMQATDYSPNRLEAAKRSAEILLESLNPKDHAGIVDRKSVV